MKRVVRRLLLAMRRAWPVSLIGAVLVVALAVPGLPADQASEAMVDYLSPDNNLELAWDRFLWVLLTAAMLAASLPVWVKLLARGFAGEFMLARLAWTIPFIGLGLATLPLYTRSGDSRYFAMLVAIVAFALAPLLLPPRLRTWIDGRLADAPPVIRAGASAILPNPRFQRLVFVRSAGAPKTWMVLATVVLVAGVVVFGLTDRTAVDFARRAGPINLFFALTFVTAAGLSMIVAAGRRLRVSLIPLVLVATTAFSYFDLNDNHPVRGVVQPVAPPSANTGPADPARPDIGPFDRRFAEWRAGRPDADSYSPYPVILVSTEGGGIRAAYFTAITLARLVDRCPRVANHIFAISGVSGGAVGATVFAAALAADPPDTSDPRCSMHDGAPPRYETRVAKVLQDDHLSPLFARLAFPDLVQRFIPHPIERLDRQIGFERGLELSFEREFGGDQLGRSVFALRWTEANPAVPYLLLNTTQVETGQRVLIAPFAFLDGDFNRLLALSDLHAGFVPTASAAAGTSARFPILSPAGWIGAGKAKRRFVDGGYVDNSGAETVIEMLRSLHGNRGGAGIAVEPATSVYLLLHIGNAPECDVARLDPKKVSPAVFARCRRLGEPPSAGGLGELFSPFRALLTARSARNELNLRRWEREITRLRDGGEPHASHRVQMYDRGTPVPLGWLLSRRATKELHDQLGVGVEGDEDRCATQINIENGCQLDGLLNDMRARAIPATPGSTAAPNPRPLAAR